MYVQIKGYKLGSGPKRKILSIILRRIWKPQAQNHLKENEHSIEISM